MALKITFSAPAVLDTTYEEYYYGLYPALTPVTLGAVIVFKTLRAAPGQCTIGTDGTDQAVKFFQAYTADLNVTTVREILRFGNVVYIRYRNDSPIFDYALDPVGTFMTFEIAEIPYPYTVVNPYSGAGNLGFTLDQQFFRILSATTNSYFQTTATLKVYNFMLSTFKTIPISDRYLPYDGEVEFNLGLVIHKMMSRFNLPNTNTFQYFPCELVLNIEERFTSTNVSVAAVTLPPIKFVAGLSRNVLLAFGFLAFNPKPSRVTVNSTAILNMLIPVNTDLQLTIFQNGTLVSTISLVSADLRIVQRQITFSGYIQGDVINCIIGAVGSPQVNDPNKQFHVLPLGPHSNTIVWEDIFLVQSSLEFTGEYNIKTDITSQTNTLFLRLVEVLEIVSVSKVVKFTINTGWILKSDIDTIESLMMSKRAWMQNGSQRISLRPIGKSILNEDSKRELIEYSVEFQINRSYNEETYSL